MRNYSLIELDELYITQGLDKIVDKEFAVLKGSYLKEDLYLIIDDIYFYLEESKRTIKNQETYGCGSWLIQFVFKGDYIYLTELKGLDNGENVYGDTIDNSVRFLKEQLQLCQSKNVQPQIPRLAQKVVISEEIYSGSEVNAVRYEAPDHMTGWYLTSNQYNGDVNTLNVDHLYHLLESRPDLAKYLALPNGFRFFKDSKGDDVWVDEG